MSDTPNNGNNPTQVGQQMIISPPSTPQSVQPATTKAKKTVKKPATPSDGLALAGLFIVVGIFASYFPQYSHTPSLQGVCQVLAYLCYSIGFLGGCIELSNLSKNEFGTSCGKYCIPHIAKSTLPSTGIPPLCS